MSSSERFAGWLLVQDALHAGEWPHRELITVLARSASSIPLLSGGKKSQVGIAGDFNNLLDAALECIKWTRLHQDFQIAQNTS